MSKAKIFETIPLMYGRHCCDGGCNGHVMEVHVDEGDSTQIVDQDTGEEVDIPSHQIHRLIETLKEASQYHELIKDT